MSYKGWPNKQTWLLNEWLMCDPRWPAEATAILNVAGVDEIVANGNDRLEVSATVLAAAIESRLRLVQRLADYDSVATAFLRGGSIPTTDE